MLLVSMLACMPTPAKYHLHNYATCWDMQHAAIMAKKQNRNMVQSFVARQAFALTIMAKNINK